MHTVYVYLFLCCDIIEVVTKLDHIDHSNSMVTLSFSCLSNSDSHIRWLFLLSYVLIYINNHNVVTFTFSLRLIYYFVKMM